MGRKVGSQGIIGSGEVRLLFASFDQVLPRSIVTTFLEKETVLLYKLMSL